MLFRFIASFHTYDWNLDMHMVWSHFKSAHGKDLSDPECGRAKHILRCHEMRHTADVPTELKSSLDQYKHLKSHHAGKLIMSAVLHSRHWVVVGTNRTFRQKKGKGIYCRVYHWMPSKKSGRSVLWQRWRLYQALAQWRATSLPTLRIAAKFMLRG